MGGPWDTPNTDLEPGKARRLAKANPEDMSLKVIQTTMRTRLSFWDHLIRPHVLFLPLGGVFIKTLFFCHFRPYVQIHFYTANGLGLDTGHWSLVVKWLGFSAHTAATRPQSLAGNWKPCFKPQQAKATRNHVLLYSRNNFWAILFRSTPEFVLDLSLKPLKQLIVCYFALFYNCSLYFLTS